MKAASLLFLLTVLTSCSMKIQHADGSVTYVGAVNLREGQAGDLPLVHSRRAGLILDAGTSQTGVAFGYDDRLVVKPPGETLTLVDYQAGSDPHLTVTKRR
jgi:hypothetical protein